MTTTSGPTRSPCDTKRRKAAQRHPPHAGRLSDGATAKYPEVAWRELRGTRVILAHAYHRVDRDLLWDILHTELPAVAAELGAPDPRVLDEATGAVHPLGGVGRLIPNPHLLIGPHLRLEAVLSSRIEGTDASDSTRTRPAPYRPPKSRRDTPRHPPVGGMLVRVMEREALQAELVTLQRVETTIRRELYSIEIAGVRATAVSALSAAAAVRVYRRSDELPQWTNETSDRWRTHLDDVWAYLNGDTDRHYALSRAIAQYLTSPLNHNEGQAGPDDFDRPQTIASYSAVASVILWGVDFATTAVAQLFELIDLQFDGTMTPSRADAVVEEASWSLDACGLIVRAATPGRSGLDREVLADLRR